MDATAQLIQELMQHGLTQTEIGARTGIPQFRMSRWARGRAPVGANDALKLKALRDEVAAGHAATVAPPPAQAIADQNLGGKF